jgi:hypothetical protein
LFASFLNMAYITPRVAVDGNATQIHVHPRLPSYHSSAKPKAHSLALKTEFMRDCQLRNHFIYCAESQSPQSWQYTVSPMPSMTEEAAAFDENAVSAKERPSITDTSFGTGD